jgi:hypothetical protein
MIEVPAIRDQILISRYLQLKHELEVAYASMPWNTDTLDRLTDELASLDRILASQCRCLAY